MSTEHEKGGDVCALIPIHRTKGNREWLQQAVNSLKGTPVLVLENDGELHEAMNAGLREAETEFVLPFGADDIAAPQMVEFLLGPAWNADVVYPSMMLVSEDLKPLGLHSADPFCGNRLLGAPYISGSSLVRRTKALEVGGWRELPLMEDWDLWVRMYRAGARFKPCPEARLYYRQHSGSRNKVEDPAKVRAELRKLIVGEPLEVRATFYNQATPATTYVRCQLPARYLPGIVRPEVFATVDDTVEFPEHQGTAVFQFAGDKSRDLTIRLMREQGVRVLVEADDNYLINPGRKILERAQWGLKIGDEPHTREAHRNIVARVDGVIVTTRWLADRYRKLNPNIHVCPNTVDPQDWTIQEKPDDGILRIVWFASKSHTEDIPLVTRAFEWASRQKDVEVFAVGLNPRWKFKYGHLPWLHDLDAYRYHFSYFDVGVAPIRETPHGLGRSDLKALEYGVAGVAPVLTDLAPYEDWKHGENCLKAKDAKSFLNAVKHLVRNRDEVKQLAAAAREYVLSERTTEKQIYAWREAVG